MKVRQKIGVIPYYSNDLSETELKLKLHGYQKKYCPNIFKLIRRCKRYHTHVGWTIMVNST